MNELKEIKAILETQKDYSVNHLNKPLMEWIIKQAELKEIWKERCLEENKKLLKLLEHEDIQIYVPPFEEWE